MLFKNQIMVNYRHCYNEEEVATMSNIMVATEMKR